MENKIPDISHILTKSEQVILQMIADNLSSKEIAAALSIKLKTVENHRSNICKKLKITGQNALLIFALQHKNAIHDHARKHELFI